MISDLIKVFLPAIVSFIIGILITPRLTKIFYEHKLWKRTRRDDSKTNPTITSEFKKIHRDDELHTPRVGGIIIWGSVLLVSTLFSFLYIFFPNESTTKLQFLSRNQTFLPLLALVIGALFGLLEDFFEIFGGTKYTHGIKGKHTALAISLIGLFFAYWFYFKLGVDSVFVPFLGDIFLGALFIPFFVLVTLSTFSSRVIDGLDGLAGGVFAVIFASYSIIAYFNNQIDIAAFCTVILGAILVFLWFNIPPARFYMGETGMLPLTLTLVVVAFLTGQVLLLLIIGFPLVATALSSLIQISSKKMRKGKTVFLVAPLHHHFQALGWSREKVVMRYWVISVICAFIGLIIYFIS